jgi:hypothetical protein
MRFQVFQTKTVVYRIAPLPACTMNVRPIGSGAIYASLNPKCFLHEPKNFFKKNFKNLADIQGIKTIQWRIIG